MHIAQGESRDYMLEHLVLGIWSSREGTRTSFARQTFAEMLRMLWKDMALIAFVLKTSAEMLMEQSIITFSLESMIKQIQLRGISRTPSDRMSEDGGLSESLNMYLDTAESAPAFVPEDVTEKLGLPEDLQAERIFIHKTANYENYIVVQDNSVYAYIGGQKSLVLTLNGSETINDTTSVGNTLVISTNKRLLYMLYKNSSYTYLGEDVPRPVIEFRTVSNVYPETNSFIYLLQQATGLYDPVYGLDVDAWNKAVAKQDLGEDTPLVAINKKIWESISERLDGIKKERRFAAPFFVRYAVRLYDLSYYHISEPILIGAGYDSFLDIEATRIRTTSSGVTTYISWRLNNVFTSVAHLIKWDIAGWDDIIQSIDIFISTPLYFPNYEARLSKLVMTANGGNDFPVNTDYYNITFQMSDETEFKSIENEILSKSVFFKYASFSLAELEKLETGYDLAEHNDILLQDVLEEQDRLSESVFAKRFTASSLSSFNNRLIINVLSQSYSEGFNVLPSTNVALRAPGKSSKLARFFAFFLEDGTKIFARDSRGEKDFYAYEVTVPGDQGYEIHEAAMFGLLFFPEVSCNKVAICDEEGYMRVVKMKRHPSLPYSYAFWGLSKTDLDLQGEDIYLDEFLKDEITSKQTNKLLVSETSNPFSFPLEGVFEFQSSVLGIAVASTALSQGQFGQFPLYVFTEDGIWAMETAADGSFISQKPLSREVCINPDSICSIDNAVVFVTSKAVMMIQGSQVMNISPYMNGKHYRPNDSALNLIRNQEGFDTLIEPISDDDPFMLFMNDAKVAYDYTGQRLVFISPSNNGFQYVYKIDTQTWHKVAFGGLDLVAPLNSYPDCLVQGKVDDYSKFYWIINPVPSPSASLTSDVMQDFSLETNIHLSEDEIRSYLRGEIGIDVSVVNEEDVSTLSASLAIKGCEGQVRVRTYLTKIYSLSTVLDAKADPENPQKVAKGILITRPFDLGMPDVYKSITSIKIRGDFDKGNVKYILQGSDDGRTFYTLSSLRGKSWKMFRIFILADLEPTERISWIDIDFEPRYQNKLR